jgi:drug/metabolite transporter (DMT)-like permease
MLNKQMKADIALLGVTVIWGASFTLMKEGIKDIPPYTFLGIRYLIGALILGLAFYKRMKNVNKESIKYGFIIGLALAGGGIFQILGLQYTTASKSGFITGLSVVIVPILMALYIKRFQDQELLLVCSFQYLDLVFLH